MFSNGKWKIKVLTVGDLVKELQRLPPEMALDQGLSPDGGADVVVFNRNSDRPVVSFHDAGDWTDDPEDETPEEAPEPPKQA